MYQLTKIDAKNLSHHYNHQSHLMKNLKLPQ